MPAIRANSPNKLPFWHEYCSQPPQLVNCQYIVALDTSPRHITGFSAQLMKSVNLQSCSGFLENLDEFPAAQYPLVNPSVYNSQNIANRIREVVTSEHKKQKVTCPKGTISRLRGVVVNPNGSLLDASGTAIEESVHDFSEKMTANETHQRSPSQKSGIVLFKYGYNNYGHWLIEMLPKLYFLKNTIDRFPNSKILIGNTTGAVRDIVYSTLEYFGLPGESLLPIKQSTEFEELIYCSPISIHPFMMRPEIRQFYHELARTNNTPQDKIFVTRPPGATRTIRKLDSIEAFFTKNGFKIIDPAGFSFLEQAEVFKNAKEVVGIAGAAMTNTIFCATGTRILHLTPPSMPNLFFYQLASICGHKYSEFRGTSDDGNMFGKQFDVDLTDLENIIEHQYASI